VADVRRKLNATETTFYRWKKRFLGLLLATRSATHSRRWDSSLWCVGFVPVTE